MGVTVGTANCDHENQEKVYSDAWAHYFKCLDCGVETREDR